MMNASPTDQLLKNYRPKTLKWKDKKIEQNKHAQT
jgi:hypothetical protein